MKKECEINAILLLKPDYFSNKDDRNANSTDKKNVHLPYDKMTFLF